MDPDDGGLSDIIDLAEELAELLQGADPKSFQTNSVLRRATERILELVGEAAGRTSVTTRSAIDQPWSQLVRVSAKGPRAFEMISAATTYRIATESIPALRRAVLEHQLTSAGGRVPPTSERTAASPRRPSLRARVHDSRDAILELARRHGAHDVRIFGSVARGDASAESDLDLLVTLDEDRSLLDHIALQQDLEDLLGVKVDVVSRGGLNPYIRDTVLREAVPI